MDISREALLLYLRDLRDLEFAKKKISALYNQKEQYMKSQLAYMKTPKLQGENNKTDGGEKFLFWFVGGTGLFMTCFGGWLMTSAMTPASRLPIEPGERVLDLCAAPGGKSFAAALQIFWIGNSDS